MKLKFVKDSWEAKGKTFYVLRYVVVDESGNIIRKGEPLVWLSEELFNSINF